MSVVKVTWQPPSTPNGEIVAYNILYTDDSSLPLKQWNSSRAYGLSANVKSLSRDSMYWIYVAARTSAGLGKYSFQPVSVKTLKYDCK